MTTSTAGAGRGPLAGLRVIELAGIGPGPFCGMLLADLGADVIRVDRPRAAGLETRFDTPARGKRSVVLDLRRPEAAEVVLRLAERSDVLFEGYRPGVVERLGIGPEECRRRNPALVYGRLTGWGQEGPLAHTAGHDLTYISVAGVLEGIGPADGPPVPPLNLIGDYAGGGMLLALGIVSAVLEARTSGVGQVVDAAMVDGAALLSTFFYGLRGAGVWRDGRENNLLDGGAPFYRAYRCADGNWVSLASMEQQFGAQMLDLLGIAADDPLRRELYEREHWDVVAQRLTEIFATRPRQEWADLFADSDGCVAPVLTMAEAPAHPHNVARGTFVDVAGVTQPAPAPRFSRTRAATPEAPPSLGQHTREVLTELGLTDGEIEGLLDGRVTDVTSSNG